jgi:hypothetical protein
MRSEANWDGKVEYDWRGCTALGDPWQDKGWCLVAAKILVARGRLLLP